MKHSPLARLRPRCPMLNDAIIRHLRRNLLLISTETDCEQLEKSVRPFRTPIKLISILSRNAFLPSFASRNISGWIDGSGIFSRPFQIRNRFSGNQYPVLFTHHSVSYRSEIYANFVPLLLAAPKEWDALVCSSRAARSQLSTILDETSAILSRENNIDVRYRGSMHVIPFGVDTDRFRPRLDKRAVRRKLGLPRDAFLFLFLGRVSAFDKADLAPLLFAAAHLAKQRGIRPFRIMIAGGTVGSYRRFVNALARDLNVHKYFIHIPRVEADNLPDLYASADIFLSPADNIQECFGLAVLEAMSCGLPQIVSDLDASAVATYHLGGTPTTILISSSGQVQQVWTGVYEPDISKAIADLLHVDLPGCCGK